MTKPFRQVGCYHVNFMKFYRTTKTFQIGKNFKLKLKRIRFLRQKKKFITKPIILKMTVCFRLQQYSGNAKTNSVIIFQNFAN